MPTTEEQAAPTLGVLNVTGTIKWFNPTKGYGFITPDGGGPDIFLQSSYLEKDGYRPPKEGNKIACEVQLHRERPEKGFLCTRVLSINGKGGSGRSIVHAEMKKPRRPPNTKGLLRVAVKWFRIDRGFGFLTEGEGTEDIIVGTTVLERYGISGKLMKPGKFFLVRVKPTAKSRTVTEIYVDTQ